MTSERIPERTLGTLRASAALAATLAGALLLPACGGSSKQSPSGGTSQPNSVVAFPPGDPNASPSGAFVADGNNAGVGQRVRIASLRWGRLVDVFALDSNAAPVEMQRDFVITPDLESDFQDYLRETNPVTGQETLTILRPVDTPAGRLSFFELLRQAEAGLVPVFEQNNGNAEFSMVPRNATIVVQFDDLIDENLVEPRTVRVRTGVPPTLPFEGRIMIDRNHGDVAQFGGHMSFFSTRVLIDATVSELESFETNPPTPVNGVGLPGAVDVSQANVAVRVPTVQNPAVGQEIILRNPSGHPVASENNGLVDTTSPTLDVVRRMRSGGGTLTTADPYNGFLPDDDPPRVIGSQPVFISIAPDPSIGGETDFLLPRVEFASIFCAQTPSVGDVFRQQEVFAEVLEVPPPQQDGVLEDVKVRLRQWPAIWDLPGRDGPLEWVAVGVGSASFFAPFEGTSDAGKEACFVDIFPTPSGYPSAPTEGLSTSSTFGLRFSEPMDPGSMTAFDSMTFTREPVPDDGDPPLASSDFVVGSIEQTSDLQEFRFVPDLPLAHTFGDAGSLYYLTLSNGTFAPTDLAGNRLGSTLPPVQTRIDPTAQTQRNGGRVTRFTSADEEPPFGEDQDEPVALPEWTGQHLYDPRELIKPRPVSRYDAVVDRTQAVPQLMAGPFALQTPLSSLGSKMQILWRYIDVGFALDDPTNHNVDVEGLNWAPVAGQVVVDHFNEFEIRLAHSRWAPDEYIDPGTLWPKFNQSGIKKNYDENSLDPAKIVHEKFRGYTVNPAEKFISSTGTEMVPFSLNEGLAPEDKRYYTWRDTGLRERGGKNSGGAPPFQYYVALGIPPPMGGYKQYYPQNEIGTIGLPLLMEFRCYPDTASQGINAFDVSIAVTSSSRPFFRAWSTGGTDESGTIISVDPDLEVKANGGFNPTSNPPGGSLFGLDPVVYMGSMDLVVRISRSYSLWFEAVDPSGGTFFTPTYSTPVVEPRDTDQPLGTEVRLAFRGATEISHEYGPFDGMADVTSSRNNAATIDAYGDWYDPETLPPNHDEDLANVGITLKDGDDSWHEDIAAIQGSRYYQLRVTFLSNSMTGLTPTLSAIAVAWSQ